MKMKKMLNHKALAYVALALACVMLGTVIGAQQTASAADTALQKVESPFTAAIAAVENSIVGVNNYQVVTYNNRYGGGYNYFPWNYFGYGDSYPYGYGNGGNDNGSNSREIEYGSGSGVVVAEHYVLTNYHVVEGASSLKVAVPTEDPDNPDLLDATVAASDEDLDVAVLYVPDLTLAPVSLGDSDELQVGDLVFNIGNPLGFTNTVTAGIVSALDRDVNTGTSVDRYGRRTQVVNTMIQTDAAINSGNSGGGMFDTAGLLVGIPTLKYSSSGSTTTASVESIGMCIPINQAKPIIELALNGGATTSEASQGSDTKEITGKSGESNVNSGLSGKPRMGVTVQTVTTALTAYGIPNGAMIMSVDAGSPAEAAGLQVQDVVVEGDGTAITSTTELMEILSGKSEGDQVSLKVFRPAAELTNESIASGVDGEYVDTTLTLAIVDHVVQ